MLTLNYASGGYCAQSEALRVARHYLNASECGVGAAYAEPVRGGTGQR